MYPAIPSTARRVSSVLAVTVVARREVVPYSETLRVMDRKAAPVPSIHVVATGSVDVHIYKTRDGRLVRGANFLGPRGQGHPERGPMAFNGIFANQDARVVNFCHRGLAHGRRE